MKIGILTLPLHINYGGILQAYALQTILERMGHEVFMLKKSTFSIKTKLIFFTKKILNKPIRKNESFEIEQFKKTYFKKWIDVSHCTKQDLESLDAVVVGSDQVWRSWGKKWDLSFYFLDFIKKLPIKKFAYSVSFGTESWEMSSLQTERCKKLVSLFSKVSVREKKGIELCRQYLGVNAEWLLDPTLLLNKNDYKSILGSSESHEKKIVSYILDYDENKKEIQQAIVGLYKGREVDLCEKRISRGNVNELPSVEFWLKEMMNAKILVTDSFHGTAFAINFEIPFVVLSNENRGQSRLQSILEMFDLKTRFVTNAKNAKEIAEMPILWENVRKIKQRYREQSISFLKGFEV